MSSIKPKIAPCIDCVEQGDSSPKEVIKGRCKIYHYPLYRNKVNSEKKRNKTKNDIEIGFYPKSRSKSFVPKIIDQSGVNETKIGGWFRSQAMQSPIHCEECGFSISHLRDSTVIIAHILPKAKNKFPEVSTHPLNRMFYCPDCHNKFDNKGNEYRSTMKSLELMKERLREFYPSLTESQQIMALKRLPFTQEELL